MRDILKLYLLGVDAVRELGRRRTKAKCGKIMLDPGNTLLFPAGWIHAVAVYMTEDSLVFGGNFAIEKQLRVAQID